MATLGLSANEREVVEAFRRDVVEPSMTSLVIVYFLPNGAARANS